MAAIRYRNTQLHADRTLIFTDARQALHFKQTEIVARKAGFIEASQEYQHCPFGMMLGKRWQTICFRSGDTVKLVDLLDEAVERAASLIQTRNPELENADEMAHKIGIGAVKYADLAKQEPRIMSLTGIQC